ncbi:exported hypothetical protein [Nitrosomonas mobilis]|uniref:Transposase n=1 Tax=Nitrosomonas mobilis TaxID=51642 RepID=A0A1G5SJL7_9PROT|nr:exported hypothetical protein [Nitrosomonas mobilis]
MRCFALCCICCAPVANGDSCPVSFPKWQSVYAYWRKWSEPDQHGVSVLEQVLKNQVGATRETGAQRLQHVLDRGCAEREKYGHGWPEGL